MKLSIVSDGRPPSSRALHKAVRAVLLSMLIIFICASAFCGCVSAEDKQVSTWADLKAALEDQTCTIQTVTLSQDINESATKGIDITVENATVINKTKILNLNGHTINISGENKNYLFPFLITEGGSLTVNGNGIIECNKRLFKLENGTLKLENGEFINLNVTEDSYSMIGIYGCKTEGNNNHSKFTLDENAKLIDGDWAIGIFNNDYPSKGNGYQIVIDIKGNITTYNSGIAPNGLLQPEDVNSNHVPQIHIYSKAVINAPNGCAVYGAGYGNWTFDEGCNVTGSSALSIKSGKFTINGGTFEATGEYHMPPIANGNGVEPSGAAVSITHGGESKNAYVNNVSLIIKDGIFTSKNQSALFEGKNDKAFSKSALDEKGITITGGQFNTGNGSLYPIHIMNLNAQPVYVTLNDKTPCYPGLNTSLFTWVNDTNGQWTVTFLKDIKTLENINLSLVKTGSTVKLVDAQEHIKNTNGLELQGWTSKDGTVYKAFVKEFAVEQVYTPSFEVKAKYDVTFYNGTEAHADKQTFISGEKQALNPNKFVKENSEFAGWAEEEKGPVVYADKQVITIQNAINLYAVWNAIKAPAKNVQEVKTNTSGAIDLNVTTNKVTVDTTNNTVEIDQGPVNITITYDETDIIAHDNNEETGCTNITGNISTIEATYKPINASATSGATAKVSLLINNISKITSLPTLTENVNATVANKIKEVNANLNTIAMISGTSTINDNITKVTIVFTIDSAYDTAKLKVYHVSNDGTAKQLTTGVTIENGKITITSDEGFSSYVVVNDTNTTPSSSGSSSSTSDDNYYDDDDSSSSTTTTPTPTVTPTVKPTQIPTEVPTETPTVTPTEPTVTPTKEQPTQSPMPVLGLLIGLGAAVIAMRRK